MKITPTINVFAAALLAALAFTATQTRAAEPAPRLVLQITVDQLRGDLPGRYLTTALIKSWPAVLDKS